MTAMRNATKNAGELIDHAHPRNEPSRQAEITQEILGSGSPARNAQTG